MSRSYSPEQLNALGCNTVTTRLERTIRCLVGLVLLAACHPLTLKYAGQGGAWLAPWEACALCFWAVFGSGFTMVIMAIGGLCGQIYIGRGRWNPDGKGMRSLPRELTEFGNIMKAKLTRYIGIGALAATLATCAWLQMGFVSA